MTKIESLMRELNIQEDLIHETLQKVENSSDRSPVSGAWSMALNGNGQEL